MHPAEFPIRYVDPVFRPPSEADSLILPVTNGCSWNQCTFCEMYTAPQKAFRARSEDEVLESIVSRIPALPNLGAPWAALPLVNQDSGYFSLINRGKTGRDITMTSGAHAVKISRTLSNRGDNR